MEHTNWIAPILGTLSKNLDHLLIAVGGAMEELEHPDPTDYRSPAADGLFTFNHQSDKMRLLVNYFML